MTSCQIINFRAAPAGEKRQPKAARSATPNLSFSARQCVAASGASADLHSMPTEDGAGGPKILKFRRIIKKWIRALGVLAVMTQLSACAAPAGVKVVEDKKSDGGRTIAATADDREIGISPESLASRTTRMHVVASDSAIFKDRAAEAAIIDQTVEVPDRRATARG